MMMVTGEYDNDRCVGWVVSGGIVGDTKIECICSRYTSEKQMVNRDKGM